MQPDVDANAPRKDYSEEAKGILKGALKRRGATYAQLVLALKEIGVDESEANLRNKISRGNFSASFLLQCLDAIGVTQLQLDVGSPLKARGRANVGGDLFRQRQAEWEARQPDVGSADEV